MEIVRDIVPQKRGIDTKITFKHHDSRGLCVGYIKSGEGGLYFAPPEGGGDLVWVRWSELDDFIKELNDMRDEAPR